MKKLFDNDKYLVSPQTGKVVSIRKIPDDVFSEKILGDGVAVIPTEDEVCSPVNGVVVQIAETGHAFCIKSDDGLEILIHLGVDTVALKGQGFKSLVSVGQKIKAGEIIAYEDVKFVEKKGYHTHTAIVITNMAAVEEICCTEGPVEAGVTKIISYKKKI